MGLEGEITNFLGVQEAELQFAGDIKIPEKYMTAIVSNPKIMMGKPVFAGTRITVELVLEKLAAGESIEQILEAHPRLTSSAISSALAFAVDVLRADVVYPIEIAS